MRSSMDETSEAFFLTSGFVYDSAEQAEATFNGTERTTSIPASATRRWRCWSSAWPCWKAPRPAG